MTRAMRVRCVRIAPRDTTMTPAAAWVSRGIAVD